MMLPGVVTGNRWPWNTYESDKRLADPNIDKEGYLFVDEQDLSMHGVATLLRSKREELGAGMGVQIDYWVSSEFKYRAPLMEGITPIIAEMAARLIDRAFEVSTQGGLELPPFALLEPNNPDEPSRELEQLMVPVCDVKSGDSTHSPDFRGVKSTRYQIYRAFTPQETET